MQLFLLLRLVIQVLVILIFTEVILSYVVAFGKMTPYHPFVKLVRSIVDPLLNPVRKLLPPYKTGGWDLSPMIVILLLETLQNYLY